MQNAQNLGSMYQQELLQIVNDYQTGVSSSMNSRDTENAHRNRNFCKRVRDAGRTTINNYIRNVTDSWRDYIIDNTIGIIPLVGYPLGELPKWAMDKVEDFAGDINDAIIDTTTDKVLDSLPDDTFDKGVIDENKVQEATEAIDNWMKEHDSDFRKGAAPGYSGTLF